MVLSLSLLVLTPDAHLTVYAWHPKLMLSMKTVSCPLALNVRCNKTLTSQLSLDPWLTIVNFTVCVKLPNSRVGLVKLKC